MGVDSHEDHMSGAAMAAATGRPPEEWFALLDTEGATEWTHTKLARFIADDHGVPSWWAQAVAVRYEQARGMRLPGQQSDGTFTANVSRRFAATQDEVLDAAIAALSPTFGAPYGENRASHYLRARWRLDDGSRIIASADPEATGKVPFTLTHERLAESTALDPAKDGLRQLLTAVAARL